MYVCACEPDRERELVSWSFELTSGLRGGRGERVREGRERERERGGRERAS